MKRFSFLAVLILLSLVISSLGACAPAAPKDTEINVLCTPQ